MYISIFSLNFYVSFSRLFTSYPELTGDTYVLFEALRDNYERDVNFYSTYRTFLIFK